MPEQAGIWSQALYGQSLAMLLEYGWTAMGVPGDILISIASAWNTAQLTPTVLPNSEFRVKVPGDYYTSWITKTNNVAYTASTQVYKNGAGVGGAYTTTSVTPVSSGLVALGSLAKGDLLGWYAWTNNVAGLAYFDSVIFGFSKTPYKGCGLFVSYYLNKA